MTDGRYTYLLYGEHGTTLTEDSVHASGVARSSTSVQAVVISVSQSTDSWTDRLLPETFRDLHAELFQAPSEHDRRVTAPLPGLIIRCQTDLSMLTATWGRRLLHIEVEVVDHLTTSWPETYVTLNVKSVISIVERVINSSNRPRNPERVAAEVIHIVTEVTDSAILRELREISDHSLKLVASEFKSAAALFDQQLYVQLTEFRMRAQAILSWIYPCRDTQPDRVQLYASAISECDALSASIANVHLLHLSQHLARTAEANALRDRKELEIREAEKVLSERRERNLTVIAAAFVFPTVFLSFLGINVIPDTIFGFKTQSGILVLIAFVVSVLVAAIGGFLLSKVGKEQRAIEDQVREGRST